jgi:hypothetical protein
MSTYENPFEYEQATTLKPDFVREVFIEDHNFTRFIQSNRNVFVVGERGSGKTMTLLYNSASVQRLKADACGEPLDTGVIGVYIPCNTTLTHKKEYELLKDPLLAAVISEHFMVLGIAYAIASALRALPEPCNVSNSNELREELTYVIGADLIADRPVLEAFMMYLQRESRKSQVALNALRLDEFRTTAFTFSSLVLPFLQVARHCAEIEHSHFLMLIDDAHDLNSYQRATLNSWLAYRDRSLFSFKIAVADALGYDYRTSSGGVILEGHDFLTIDLQKPFQSAGSDFGKLAREVLEKRLRNVGVILTADEFFPISGDFERDLEYCRAEVEAEADELFPGTNNKKRRRDYVYKYSRVKYFRERAARANLPPYSGFDTIAHVSTGVIRNLLMPCYWMYDRVYSELPETSRNAPAAVVPADVQSRVLRDLSDRLWRWIDTSLSSSIDNCTMEDARRIYNLLDNLGDLFRRRLLKAKSEPRALAFSISMMTKDFEDGVMRILNISRRAQLIYFRSGPAKDEGRRETYYVPNRMLWPIRGLDVVGQHARVSLKARDVWAAATGTAFPFADEANQQELFDGED